MPQIDQNLSITWRALQLSWQKLSRLFNHGIGIGNLNDGFDNLDLMWVSTTTPIASDTDFTVTHNLGRKPVGYVIVASNKFCTVCNGAKSSTVQCTTSTLTLQCSTFSATITLIVF